MEVNDTIKGLIYLPSKFNNAGNISIYDLLKETGYLEKYEKVSVEEIRNGLARCAECVEDWIVYSEDKRSSSGWYFKKKDNKRFVVGCIDLNGNSTHNEYENGVDACAIFIKHEIDEISGVAAR
jgi:hypothetical protein